MVANERNGQYPEVFLNSEIKLDISDGSTALLSRFWTPTRFKLLQNTEENLCESVQVENNALSLKKYYKNERHLCLVTHVFITL